ncbi:MAG: hypothetical protein H0S85_02900 [Desulfovibrionaceae bacterium]|jgi:hypothetical protein|nr:hypothetical protein [Desulfovibrionaceae bacterium]
MSLSISSFREVGGSGLTYGLNAKGTDLVALDKTFKGRVVCALRKLFTPGRVAEENRQVMRAFVKTFRTRNFSYTADYANLAERVLHDDIKAGKPLTGRTVQKVFDAIGKRLTLLEGINSGMATAMTNLGPSGEFRSIFADVMRERGLPEKTDSYDTMFLRMRIAEKIKSPGGFAKEYWVTSHAKAQTIVREHARELAGQVQKNLRVLDEVVPKTSPEYEPLKQTLLRSPAGKVTPDYIRGMVAVRGAVEKFAKELGSGDKDALGLFDTVRGLSTAFFAEMGKSGAMIGGEDVLNFYQDAMSFAVNSGAVSKEDMRKGVELLGSERGVALRSVIEGLQSLPTRSERTNVNRQTGNRTQQVLARMVTAYSWPLGLSEAQENELVQRPVVKGVDPHFPKQTRLALEARGLGAPLLPGSVNNVHSGNFGPSVAKAVEGRVNELFTTARPKFDEHGLSDATQRDMSGTTMVVDGVEVGKPGLDEREGASRWRKLFSGPGGGQQARALSSVLHQGLGGCLTSILSSAKPGDGIRRPFVGDLGGGPSDTRLESRIDEKTGDRSVRMTFTSTPRFLNQAGGDLHLLDQGRSAFDFVLEGRISRESMERGEPRFVLDTAAYSMNFMEAQE